MKFGLPAQETIFLDELNDLSLPARYPDELKKILKEYNKKERKKYSTVLRGFSYG